MERSLQIFLVDDEEIIHQTIGGHLRELGHHVEDAYHGAAALESIKMRDYDVSLVDLRMPRVDGMSLLARIQEMRPDMPVVIITGHGSMEMAVQALRLGAADFLTKPIKLLELEAVLERSLHLRELNRDRRRLSETIRNIQASENARLANRGIIGVSAATCKVREEIRQAVDAGCDTILITGETGTGKEVIAREIHFQTGSDESPFIAVSCPALPDTLVESELFGHVKGAFTGATEDRAGCFELADGGALFLDEVGDLSAPAQAKLLRVLDTRAIRRVGSSEEKSVNVRVIAATNASLEGLVEAGKFRRDLFYRLNVYSIHHLPLRERREDICPLAELFLSSYARGRSLRLDGFSASAKELLLSYDYPGNARELRNIIERAGILCRSGQIQAEHLSLPEPSESQTSPGSIESDEERARDRILTALEKAKWNRRQAAKDLDIPYSTLRYKLKTLGIE